MGEHAVLADYPDTGQVLRAADAVRALAPDGLVDLVPAERTLLLIAGGAADARHLALLMQDLPEAPASDGPEAEVRIEASYDGEDLAEVAEALDMSASALVDAHTRTTWRAAFGGFAPGFAYLLPEGAGSTGTASDVPGGKESGPPWDVPRRHEPRTRIPAGSVALASRYCGIYPGDSPGGWQLIGRTSARLWDSSAKDPALLTPGIRVRFRAVRESAAIRALADRVPALGVPARRGQVPRGQGLQGSAPHPTPTLTLVDPGPLSLVEDGGRPGNGALGVSTSGAADHGALVRANLAVGNPPHAAGIEFLLGPVTLQVHTSAVLALAGASAPVEVTPIEDEVRHPHPTEAWAVDAGDVVRIGPLRGGLRAFLAVRGGIGIPAGADGTTDGTSAEVLGSLASDTLGHLGPAPLGKDASLLIGPTDHLDAIPEPDSVHDRDPLVPGAHAAFDDVDTLDDVDAPADSAAAAPAEPPESPASSTEPLPLPLVPGPRDELLGADGLEALLRTTWTVRSDSDRVGVRLDGEPLSVPEHAATLPSEGMVPGAVQVPPSGLPVVFGPDHPATGGYPVIGVLTSTARDSLAQVPPGGSVRFVRATDATAEPAARPPVTA
jgi:KipI family sensor histidine kinase inhibitor